MARRRELPAEDLALAHALLREYLQLKAERVKVEQAMLDLRARYEELSDQMARCSPGAVSEKFNISKTAAVYLMRPR